MIAGACQLGGRVGKITNIKQNLLECGWSKSPALFAVVDTRCLYKAVSSVVAHLLLCIFILTLFLTKYSLKFGS